LLKGAGANVVVASRKADACEETEKHLNVLAAGAAKGGRALGVATHMGDVDALGALVDVTVAKFGGVDIIVNNAATGLAMPIGEFTPEAWDKQFEVNLRGPMFLIQAALPYLEQSEHASVINVISAGAFLAGPQVSMYAAAKAALMSFTRSFASGLAKNSRQRACPWNRRHRHGSGELTGSAGRDGGRLAHEAGGSCR
jgi:NAD(P)-dependent dehydrogenase (short-subunit alcohol dehydrogenase family)